MNSPGEDRGRLLQEEETADAKTWRDYRKQGRFWNIPHGLGGEAAEVMGDGLEPGASPGRTAYGLPRCP